MSVHPDFVLKFPSSLIIYHILCKGHREGPFLSKLFFPVISRDRNYAKLPGNNRNL